MYVCMYVCMHLFATINILQVIVIHVKIDTIQYINFKVKNVDPKGVTSQIDKLPFEI